MFFNSQIYKIQVFKFLKISIIQLIKKSVLLEKFKKAKNNWNRVAGCLCDSWILFKCKGRGHGASRSGDAVWQGDRARARRRIVVCTAVRYQQSDDVRRKTTEADCG